MATSDTKPETRTEARETPWSRDFDLSNIQDDQRYEVHAKARRREFGEISGRKSFFIGWWAGGRPRSIEYAFQKKEREFIGTLREQHLRSCEDANTAPEASRMHATKIRDEIRGRLKDAEETFKLWLAAHGYDRTMVETVPAVDGVCWGDGIGTQDPQDSSGKTMIEIAPTCHVIKGWQLKELIQEMEQGLDISVEKYRTTALDVDLRSTQYPLGKIAEDKGQKRLYCKADHAKQEKDGARKVA